MLELSGRAPIVTSLLYQASPVAGVMPGIAEETLAQPASAPASSTNPKTVFMMVVSLEKKDRGSGRQNGPKQALLRLFHLGADRLPAVRLAVVHRRNEAEKARLHD